MSAWAYNCGATGAFEKASSPMTSHETAAKPMIAAANTYLNIFIIASHLSVTVFP
jgi:hypothetical protein